MTQRKSSIGIFIVALTLAVMGWTNPSGASQFTDSLSKDYFDLARVQYYYSHDRFAVKGRAADTGKNVLPDDPAKVKQLKAKNPWRPRLIASYERLMEALNGGFRDQNPKQAARAQSSFDCWLWAVVENDKKCIEKCRKAFLAAMNAWSPPMVAPPKPMPMPKPVAQPKPAPPAPPRSFIVFFDWDRAAIRGDAQQVIDAAVAYAKRRGFSGAKLSGHADRSGKAQYNMGLSNRRANAVKAAMVKLGMNAGNISTTARGESDPLVTTADGVREPRNRRVEISF